MNFKAFPKFARFFAFLLCAVFAQSFPAPAAVIPPGGLAATPAGQDLTLSFATTSPNYYTVQTSQDLESWSNGVGIAGNGTTESVTVSNAFSGSHGFYRLVIQMPVSLILPQGDAFAVLGHSCGGIDEQVSTAGFDVTSGYPTAVVNLSTSCGGSGRGGGYHTTKYTASALVTWDLAGNIISVIPLTNGVTVNPTTSGDGLGDVVFNAGSLAYLVVPVPAAPVGVTAIQSGDQFQVSWTSQGVNPTAVLSSTVTAIPVYSSAATLTASVTGPATSGIITGIEPMTMYQITVVNTTIGGSSAASAPITVTTVPASVPPSAPAGVAASWSNPDPSGTTDTLVATWQAAVPGNSPVDQYLVTITGSDGGGTLTQTVDGSTLTAYFSVNDVPNWSVTIQAHNAAGWGPVSAAVHLGGL